MKILTNLDLSRNELQNAVLQPLASAPANPRMGQIYFNSTDKAIYSYTGEAWQIAGTVVEESETNGKLIINGEEITVYELPVATTETAGGIIVGDGATVDENGKVNVIPSAHYSVEKTSESETDNAAITRAVGGNTLRNGDTCIVKTAIYKDAEDTTKNKYSHTAFVYANGNWQAMDGNYNAENVYFDQDFKVTYQFGKHKPDATGSVTIPATSKNVLQLIQESYSEDTDPTVDQPSVSISVSDASGEVGSSYTLPTATLKVDDVGSYTYGSKVPGEATIYGKESTGVTYAIGDVTLSEGSGNSKSNTSAMVKGNTLTLQADDDTGTLYTDNVKSYTFTATAVFTASNRVPITALGNERPAKKIGYMTEIPEDKVEKYPYGYGTTTVSSKTAKRTGWRKMFMGTVGSDNTNTAIDTVLIRETMNKLVDAQVSTTAQTFTVPKGATKIIIACPDGYTVSKYEYFTMSWEEFSGFVEADAQVNVADARGGQNGLKPYNVSSYTPAGAFESDTQFRITLKTV